ncbi:MAG: sigma factor-like helix-turn-helix DNA-binding protein [Tissierellia bacterium]|nr:sigma factor-like helix-turn-helix DNA-binding protein [Tissierellia bacterium]MDD4781584.1 sigma factor-like helix-turn-helix DNA-binding protein [Tissierellia bacterium]
MSGKNFIYSILFDYYGDLLKDNQASIIDLYYNQDYSLSEIAEEMNISRQGVHDALKRAEKSLVEYEDKIKLHDKYMKYLAAAENIIKLVSTIDDEKYLDIINNIKEEANKIINEG